MSQIKKKTGAGLMTCSRSDRPAVFENWIIVIYALSIIVGRAADGLRLKFLWRMSPLRSSFVRPVRLPRGHARSPTATVRYVCELPKALAKGK